jgi:hypothetical protein
LTVLRRSALASIVKDTPVTLACGRSGRELGANEVDAFCVPWRVSCVCKGVQLTCYFLTRQQRGLTGLLSHPASSSDERSIILASASGWSWCSMWPASGCAHLQLGTDLRRSWYSLQCEFALPPQAQAVVAGLHTSTGACDALVQRPAPPPRLVQVGVDDLVGRVHPECAIGPARSGPRPVLGQPGGLVLAQSGIGLHQAAPRRLHGCRRPAAPCRHGAGPSAHPSTWHNARGLRRACGGHAKAFQVDQAADALGAYTA